MTTLDPELAAFQAEDHSFRPVPGTETLACPLCFNDCMVILELLTEHASYYPSAEFGVQLQGPCSAVGRSEADARSMYRAKIEAEWALRLRAHP